MSYSMDIEFSHSRIDDAEDGDLKDQALLLKRLQDEVVRTETYLDSLKLRLNKVADSQFDKIAATAWMTQGASFPDGTLMRMFYKNHCIAGVIQEGAWFVMLGERRRRLIPFKAARELTGNSIEGLIQWDAKMSVYTKWRLIARLRPEFARRNPRSSHDLQPAEAAV